MTTDEFHKLHAARPFQRFTIRLGDGQALQVAHPEMLAYAPKHRTAIVYRKNGSFEIIDLLLVTELEVHPRRTRRNTRQTTKE